MIEPGADALPNGGVAGSLGRAFRPWIEQPGGIVAAHGAGLRGAFSTGGSPDGERFRGRLATLVFELDGDAPGSVGVLYGWGGVWQVLMFIFL